MNTLKFLSLLILVLAIQFFINEFSSNSFSFGIVPLVIFGIAWNLRNGIVIYRKIGFPRDFALLKFKLLSAVSIFYFIGYMCIINIYSEQLNSTEPSSWNVLFFAIAGITLIIPICAAVYNINFVTKGLSIVYQDRHFRLLTVTSLIAFPLGIIWIQPKVDYLPASEGRG